jgi:hypothetical protein
MYYEIERKGNSQLSIINMLISITFSILSFLSRRQPTVFLLFFSNSKIIVVWSMSSRFCDIFFCGLDFLNFDFKCHNYKCLNHVFFRKIFYSNRVFRVLFVFVDELFKRMGNRFGFYNFNFSVDMNCNIILGLYIFEIVL